MRHKTPQTALQVVPEVKSPLVYIGPVAQVTPLATQTVPSMTVTPRGEDKRSQGPRARSLKDTKQSSTRDEMGLVGQLIE